MFLYLLQVSFLLGISLMLYQFVLSSKTMFNFNRCFLLSTLLGSIFIPLIPIEYFFKNFINKSIYPIVNVSELNELVIVLNPNETSPQIHFSSFIEISLLIGSIIFLIRFSKELFYVVQLKRRSEKVYYQGIKIYKIDKKNQVFSFGKALFIDADFFEKIYQHHEVLLHEKAHIQQYHTIDRLIVEICKIAFWFHPFIYKYAEHIKINHEFLADAEVLKETNDIKKYQYQLLDFIQTKHNSLVSTFNFKLTKKRFIMMKNKTKLSVQNISKVAVTLVVISAFALIACSKKEQAQKENTGYTEILINETEVEEANVNDNVSKFVEQKALPKGGIQIFYSEFMREFNPPLMSNNSNDTLVTVVLNFVVEKDGEISNIKVVNNTDKGFADEAIRVLESMPNWVPAKNNGEVVRSDFNLPIKIKVIN